ncbi:MAG TPA: DUF433 domain-containing protein [Verrucomicrobiota bacterium]|nr:DUF433 domain-containing protein [Verrucomicrobiota bacterium]
MATSEVLSIRLPAGRGDVLRREARRRGRSLSELGALFIDERLREAEFAHVEFRDSAVGRQAYIRGTRLAVWQVVRLLRARGEDEAAAAAHLGWPVERVKAAVHYAQSYAQEIADALADHEAFGVERLARLLPSLEVLDVPPPPRRKRAR